MNRMTKTAALVLAGTLIAVGCNEKEYVHVGSNWGALYELEPPESTFQVEASADAQRYELGETLTFDIISARSGRLWVVHVASNDEVSVLVPADEGSDNRIDAGETVSIPMEAVRPAGESIVGFIVTTGDLGLQDVLSEGKGVPKALRLVQDAEAWGIAKEVVAVEPAEQ